MKNIFILFLIFLAVLLFASCGDDTTTISGTFAYDNNTLSTTYGTAISSSVPTWTGAPAGQIVSYSISPPTAGITIDASTGVITVAATTAAQISTQYTIIATGTGNYTGTQTAVISIGVVGLLRTLTGHTNNVYSVAWSPDGTKLVSASSDVNFIIWNANTWEVIRVVDGYGDAVPLINSLAWSPDSTQFASGNHQDTARIWANTGESIRILIGGHPNDMLSVAWSRDGTQLASGGTDTIIRIWSTGGKYAP